MQLAITAQNWLTGTFPQHSFSLSMASFSFVVDAAPCEQKSSFSLTLVFVILQQV
jgi:hypothetical protein